ncbi:MAG: DUF952 domain-containing protein [Clostridia bacterium]|nr:DUF952 domain-containing protein [Clostridia bacterium]
MIYHILKKRELKKAEESGRYTPVSIHEEGFIHCSEFHQLIKVANSIYKHESQLMVMVIDPKAVEPKIVYEDLYQLNEEYPHIYGALNMNACVNVHPLLKDEDGKFIINETMKK